MLASDFVNGSTMITMAPGDTSALVFIPIIDDKIVEEDEKFDVILWPQGNGIIVGNPGQAEVIIVNDDECELCETSENLHS